MISRARIAGFLLMTMLFPLSTSAAVVINEIAWMGTSVSANAEWIELYNSGSAAVDLTSWRLIASGGSPSITLAGSIGAGGYFLLERTSDDTVPSVAADQIYTGALNNSGATLTLSDAGGITADEVVGGSNWTNIGGDNASKQTAQRASSGWQTTVATPRAANPGASSSSSSQPQQQSSSATTTTGTSANSSSGTGTPEYLPIPSLRIVAGADRSVSSSADTAFTAIVYDNGGKKRDDAFVTWSFGDGMRKIGAGVYHAYREPGEYVAVVHATTLDGGDAFEKVIVTVQNAGVRIVSVTPKGVSIANEGKQVLDLSLWRLTTDGKEFRIPEDTHILAGRTVVFPPQVTGLPSIGPVSLLYPSGEIAFSYSVNSPAEPGDSIGQLPVQAPSYKLVSEVEPIFNARTEVPAHDEAVEAPTAATELAAVGAVPSSDPPAPASRISRVLGSPWTLSFLGLIALAGGAFIFL